MIKIQAHQISFCNWFRSKFTILTLFSSEKQFNQSVFCDWGTRRSVESVSSSRISNCSASLGHGLDQVVNHLRWDNHPLLLECVEQVTHVLQGSSLCLEHCCPIHPKRVRLGLNLGTWNAGGESGCCCSRGTVWCAVVHEVWTYRVELQFHTTFDGRQKTAKELNK